MEKKNKKDKEGTKLFLIFTGIGLGLIVLFIFISSQIFQAKISEGEPQNQEETTEEELPFQGKKIVIDAGHGGEDPGKVGVHGTLEKNVNLKIATKLAESLRALGMTVILTRETDISLGEGAKNKKMQDLKLRVGLMDENNPDLAISIHQNSFTDPDVYGPQVFYHENNEHAHNAARCVQEALNAGLSVERPRECKDNVSYYLLSNTKADLIIAECAFLSNEREEELLNDEDYIDKIVASLVTGICTYLECQ